MELKKAEVAKAAKELNEVLGLDPRIQIKGTGLEELKEKVREAAQLVEPDDEISDETMNVITALIMPEEEEEEKEEETVLEEEGNEEEEAISEEGEEEFAPEENEEETTTPHFATNDSGAISVEDAINVLTAENNEEEGEKEEPKNAKGNKGGTKHPGVIATIAQLIEDSGEEGITKEGILNELSKRFPEKNIKSMKNTVNVQVPNRISKERFLVEKVNGNHYRRRP